MPKNIRETKLSVYHRAKILSVLKHYGSLTISQLSEYMELSRPALYSHLDSLKRQDLVSLSKDKKKKGAPVTISLTKKADPVPLKMLEATWGKIRKWQGIETLSSTKTSSTHGTSA